MKILVTGANGYIGSKVVTELIDMGHDVVAVDLKSDHIDKRAKIVLLDIFANKDYFVILGKPDVCLHLAWRDGFVHNSVNHILDLSNHFIFLKNLIDSGLKHLAVMGTMHEAGYYEGMISELTYTNPISFYGISKDCLRRSLKNYCAEKNVLFQWLRAYYIYGDDSFGNSIFCKLVSANKAGKETFPFTTGKNKFDFVEIHQLVRMISMSICQEKICGEINVCSGVPVSLSDKIEWYIKAKNLNIRLDYGKYPDRPTESPCLYGDNSKINLIMGGNDE